MPTTKTFVSAEAQIISITHLSPGDCYKRLEKKYDGTYELHMGVVTDVLNNGNDTAITALEFPTDYNGTKATLKVFGTDNELKLFGVDPTEVGTYMTDLLEKVGEQREAAMRKLTDLDRVFAAVEKVAADSERGVISAAPTKVLEAASE